MQRANTLTDEEAMLLHLIASECLTNAAAAQRLDRSEKTVERMLANIAEKLGLMETPAGRSRTVNRRAQLILAFVSPLVNRMNGMGILGLYSTDLDVRRVLYQLLRRSSEVDILGISLGGYTGIPDFLDAVASRWEHGKRIRVLLLNPSPEHARPLLELRDMIDERGVPIFVGSPIADGILRTVQLLQTVLLMESADGGDVAGAIRFYSQNPGYTFFRGDERMLAMPRTLHGGGQHPMFELTAAEGSLFELLTKDFDFVWSRTSRSLAESGFHRETGGIWRYHSPLA